MDLRGAKSNVMSLFETYRNRNCPLVALVEGWPAVLLQDRLCHADFFNHTFEHLNDLLRRLYGRSTADGHNQNAGALTVP